ncbi:hypothetical protein VNO78_15527 [Psophocarpus tetragonolobus]|uniref:Uncharacterized protein n=1 Tax=Psophocarpus tetragonolobus TaxID=3891 RepID=A0AAN9SFI0_PSOTE
MSADEVCLRQRKGRTINVKLIKGEWTQKRLAQACTTVPRYITCLYMNLRYHCNCKAYVETFVYLLYLKVSSKGYSRLSSYLTECQHNSHGVGGDNSGDNIDCCYDISNNHDGDAETR